MADDNTTTYREYEGILRRCLRSSSVNLAEGYDENLDNYQFVSEFPQSYPHRQQESDSEEEVTNSGTFGGSPGQSSSGSPDAGEEEEEEDESRYADASVSHVHTQTEEDARGIVGYPNYEEEEEGGEEEEEDNRQGNDESEIQDSIQSSFYGSRFK